MDTAVEHLSLAMINSYTGFTGSVDINAATNGIFKYNGSALGYSCGNILTSLCHKGKAICVENGSIANHLSKGDVLGNCPSNSTVNKRPAFENAETTIKLNAYPNPISKSATISFSLSQPENVSIRIYDMMGRLIKKLVDAQMQAGAHQLIWNVKDEKGNAANEGIYFLRLENGNHLATIKLVVIR